MAVDKKRKWMFGGCNKHLLWTVARPIGHWLTNFYNKYFIHVLVQEHTTLLIIL
jgi:hypothetical protein